MCPSAYQESYQIDRWPLPPRYRCLFFSPPLVVMFPPPSILSSLLSLSVPILPRANVSIAQYAGETRRRKRGGGELCVRRARARCVRARRALINYPTPQPALLSLIRRLLESESLLSAEIIGIALLSPIDDEVSRIVTCCI